MAVIYTAKVDVRSGRDGAVRSSDGHLDVKLAFPQALGGDGKGTNPEQLFAAGYAACFASSLAHVARSEGKPLSGVEAHSEVDMLQENGGFDLSVRLVLKAQGVDRGTLEALVEKTKGVCPYSRATRGTLRTDIRLVD